MGGTVSTGPVVVGVDGSDHAERALRWAADQACLEGRTLVVLAADGSASTVADAAAATARDLRPRLSVQSSSVREDPREVLIEASRTAHLVVLGSRGRGTLRTMLLGSVSATVCAHASCPVVVCRPGTEGTPHGVLVGADGTPQSRPVIEFAYRQASLRRTSVTVLHCYWDAVAAVRGIHEASGDLLDAPEFGDLHALLAESVAGFAEVYPDVPVTLSARHGLVDRALTSQAESWDLIVVGRHPAASVGSVLAGSVATAVLERSHSPVAVVPVAAVAE